MPPCRGVRMTAPHGAIAPPRPRVKGASGAGGASRRRPLLPTPLRAHCDSAVGRRLNSITPARIAAARLVSEPARDDSHLRAPFGHECGRRDRHPRGRWCEAGHPARESMRPAPAPGRCRARRATCHATPCVVQVSRDACRAGGRADNRGRCHRPRLLRRRRPGRSSGGRVEMRMPVIRAGKGMTLVNPTSSTTRRGPARSRASGARGARPAPGARSSRPAPRPWIRRGTRRPAPRCWRRGPSASTSITCRSRS
jgi:hypothetical protein